MLSVASLNQKKSSGSGAAVFANNIALVALAYVIFTVGVSVAVPVTVIPFPPDTEVTVPPDA